MLCILFLASALITTCSAELVFNVIGFPSSQDNKFAVSVNGKLTTLATSATNFPVWSGIAVDTLAASSFTYQYVELDPQGNTVNIESFNRTIADSFATRTPNEFFQRSQTNWKLPEVPQVYNPTTLPSSTKIFDASQIATFHLMVDSEQFSAMMNDPAGHLHLQADLRYITDSQIYSQTNVTFGISGKSSTEYAKQSFRLDFNTQDGQSFFSRPHLKLRSEATDPTMIREKIYIDMLTALGCPTQEGAWVRLYVNGQGIGLYLMVDDIKKSFLKQTIHEGNPSIIPGALYQMNAPLVEDQADLTFLGDHSTDYNSEIYKTVNLGSNPVDDPLKQLIDFMRALSNFDTTSSGAIAFWNDWLDLEGFLRNMAMEYLGGSWDAYWYSGSNYFIYFNPTLGGPHGGKLQWISTDFDGVLGDGDPTDTLTTYQSYADFSYHDRPMITKLILYNKKINQRFETILKETVGWAFKPEGLFPRIDKMEAMLTVDIEWDYSITKLSPGQNQGWRVEDFHQGISGALPGEMGLGVKPWIEGRAVQLQQQLGFKVEPGNANMVPPMRLSRARKNAAGRGGAQADGFGSSGAIKLSVGTGALVSVMTAFLALVYL